MQRNANYSSGDRSEVFAENILSAFAATVRVQRQADFGDDFHCSLLKREGANLRPYLPFNVQIKSAGKSAKAIWFGKPKKKGAKLPSAKPDFRAVPAGAINANDAFGAWEAELLKFGFAIIHNKVVVIDPFSDNCAVVTGSHNLGFRASHNNDENMVIIRGHRGLAEAYACHVLDLYDHYAFRFLLKQHPEVFGRPLQGDDTWQERYIIGKDEKSPELRFWLSAAAKGDTSGSGTLPPRKPRAPSTPRAPSSAPGEKASKKKLTKKKKTRKKTKTTEKAARKKTVKKKSKKKVAKKKAIDRKAKKKSSKKRTAKKKVP
jgi:hypothetical protein